MRICNCVKLLIVWVSFIFDAYVTHSFDPWYDIAFCLVKRLDLHVPICGGNSVRNKLQTAIHIHICNLHMRLRLMFASNGMHIYDKASLSLSIYIYIYI